LFHINKALDISSCVTGANINNCEKESHDPYKQGQH